MVPKTFSAILLTTIIKTGGLVCRPYYGLVVGEENVSAGFRVTHPSIFSGRFLRYPRPTLGNWSRSWHQELDTLKCFRLGLAPKYQ